MDKTFLSNNYYLGRRNISETRPIIRYNPTLDMNRNLNTNLNKEKISASPKTGSKIGSKSDSSLTKYLPIVLAGGVLILFVTTK